MEMLEHSSTGPMYVEDSMNDESMGELNDDEEDVEFENDRCGICSDVIIDRGLLDCCDHWFCFTCIDNWAAITNHCPLCKNEFQLITCLPVYDITGSIRIENSSTFRDDDWGIQGKNSALSFPSYYINEDAVICLDGDDCKVRSGLSTLEDDLNLDTSIACDSCDLWYHAFCVGFDPECPSEGSWLCPRCLSAEEQQESDLKHSVLKGTDLGLGWSIDPSLSGKVSVSVADDGETALVVSMVQGNQRSKANKISPLESMLDMSTKKESENSDRSVKLNAQVEKTGHSALECYSPIHFDDKECDAISAKSQHSYDKLLDISTEMCIIQREGEPKEKSSAPSVSGYTVSGIMTDDTCQSKSDLFQVTHDGMSVVLSDEKVDVAIEDHPVMIESAPYPKRRKLSDEVVSSSSLNDDNESIQEDTKVTELVAKHADESSLHMMNVDFDNLDAKNKGDFQLLTKVECTAKKATHDEKSQMIPSVSQVNASISGYSESCRKEKSVAREDLDIMSIVRETNHKADGQEKINNLKGIIEKKDSSAGLRVKKIMRRVEDKKEMADLVQKLGKEIDESVQGKTFGRDEKDNTFEEKLLTAFREAIVKSKDEVTQKLDPSLLTMRNKLLQKGKVRENLTKKIYGTANGRRRRAWDRDWEVEFWKHRCSSIKREKIDTLRSVLAHLKEASTSCLESPEANHEPEDGMGNSILSRIYLADASVFPRKNDIKPLSAVDQSSEVVTGGTCQFKGQPSSNSSGNSTEMQKVTINPVSLSSTTLKGRAQATRGSAEKIASAKRGQTQMEPVDQSISAKTDKRKWALEVLARKNALTSSSADKDNKQEDNGALKGNFPLLAQLPSDMRPVLASIRHNKVPASVRQAQLHRITEHYLRRTNLTVIRRTADTELAVVDAINVEKDLSERSSSKMVYLNLCAQFLSQTKPTVASKSVENINHSADDSSANLESEMDETVNNSSSKPLSTLDSDAEEALRNAGLLSDSPPCSPVETINEPKEDAILSDEQGHVENLLETDNHPESDINTEFECNLEDKDYSGSFNISNASKVYKTKPENGISKMKVPFSTLKSEKTESHNIDDDLMVEAPVDLHQHQNADDKESMHVDIHVDDSSTPKPAKGDGLNKLCLSEREKLHGSEKEPDGSLTSKSANEGDGLNKLCLSECEKFYGSEKEPLVITKPSEAAIEDECMNIETTIGNKISQTEKKKLKSSPVDTGSCSGGNIVGDDTKCEPFGGESSLTHSHASKDVSRDEQSKPSTKDIPDFTHAIFKKVEAYVKEHIRPLCKSGVITVDQYRWAVGRTTEKVMMYHSKAKNANFLIKEGDKVKKLAEQYVEIAQQKEVL